jgi:hypothetical protein
MDIKVKELQACNIGIQDELCVSINLLHSNAPKLKACNSLHEINVEIEKSFLPEAY